MTSGSPFDYAQGWRMGHEYAGEIVEVGKDVEQLKVGDRVACMPGAGCGSCDACKRGQLVFCPSVRSFGAGFGEYLSVDARSAIPFPRSMSMCDGALVEPLAVGLHALNMAHFEPGQNLLVLGAGSMALATVYWGRRLGAANITVVSRSAHRADVAMAIGADTVINFDDIGPEGLTAGNAPPDIVAECVGKAGMLDRAVQLVRPGGAAISLGMCTQTEPLLAASYAFKDVSVLFPIAYSLPEFEQTARALDDGHVQPEVMVSDVISLDALPGKLEAMRQGAKTLKVMVDPTLSS